MAPSEKPPGSNPPEARRAPRSASALVRPLVRQLRAYVPGEQPKIKGLIKLNTNENPFPPSPRVLRAVQAAVDGRLRRYPSPTADLLREKLARFHGCQSENIIVGNGSDELLAMAVRAFVEPKTVAGVGQTSGLPVRRASGPPSVPPSRARGAGGSADRQTGGLPHLAAARSRTMDSRTLVQYFTPSYSLYPVLADIHGARTNAVPLARDFGLPSLQELRRLGQWDFRAALTFVTTPNAPSGRAYSVAELETLCRAQSGVVVLDEAYVDFGPEHALALALKHPHVIVARTFSKGYALCFLRVGYFVGHPELIAALHKIRDSYNVNGLGQIAAAATLADLPYYRKNFRRVIATRERVRAELAALGFEVPPSQANFILVRPPRFPARDWLEKLRQQKILVRWFNHPDIQDCLRISIGTEQEMETFLRAVRRVGGSGMR